MGGKSSHLCQESWGDCEGTLDARVTCPCEPFERRRQKFLTFSPPPHFLCTASHCRHVLPYGSLFLAGISVLCRFHFVGRSQHVFLDCPPSRLQGLVSHSTLGSTIRIDHVLYNMDLDTLLYISLHVCHLFVHGLRSHPGYESILALGNDFHRRTCGPLCVECQVDV